MTWKKYLFAFRKKQKNSKLTAIYIADKGGEKMQLCQSAEVIINKGIVGDRYYNGKGYWHPVESCQVTLISIHDLQQAKKRRAVTLDQGEHRRNLVITGIKTQALENKTFRIGTAVFSYHKPRPPCGYINQLTQKNMAKALGKNSGICLYITESGKIAIGDTLRFI